MDSISGDARNRTNRETAWIGLFDSGKRLVHVIRLEGEAGHVALPLRAIAGEAILWESRYLLLLHNHASGNPEPSATDIHTTRALCRTLRPLGIRVFDHIIQADTHWFSFREHRML